MTFKRFLCALLVIIPCYTISGGLVSEDFEVLSKHFGFGEMQIIKLDYNIQNLLTGDFNNDQLQDIALANNYKSRIDILLQNKSKSNATSQYVETRPEDIDINELAENTNFKKLQLPVNMQIHSLVTGDFNSDSLADFAFYGEPAGLYIIYQKNNSADSNNISLEWDSPEKIKIDDGLNYTNALICSDINADGKDDILLAAKNCIYVIVQTDNTFAKPEKYAFTENILWLKAADINSDGNLDIIVITNQASDNTRIRLGNGDGTFGPVKRYDIERPIALEFDNSVPNSVKMFTIERQSGRLSCYKYMENQKLDQPNLSIKLYPMPASDMEMDRDIAIGDFDGDKLDDIVISQPDSAEITVYHQQKDGTVSNAKNFPAYSKITTIHSANLDSDPADELIILSISEKTVGITRQNNGRFEFPVSIPLTGEPIGIYPANIDSGKSIDCFYLYRDVNDVRYMDVIYDFATKKQKTADLAIKIDQLQSNPQGMLALDADQDGLMDVIIYISQYVSPILLHQTKKGNFEVIDKAAGGISALENTKIQGAFTENINESPQKELLIAYGNYARSLVLEDKRWKVLDQYNARDTSSNIDCAIAFDIDGDKKKEILLFDGSKQVMQVLKDNQDNTYRFEKEYDIGKWRIKKILPYNISRKDALLVFDGQKFAIMQMKSYGSKLDQIFSYESKIKDARYGRLAAGDMNNDGVMDVTLVDFKKNNIEILSLNEMYQPVPAFRFKVFEEKSYQRPETQASIEPREILTDDLNADGLNDLIVIVHDRVIVYPQDK